jgi:hypothetical protein
LVIPYISGIIGKVMIPIAVFSSQTDTYTAEDFQKVKQWIEEEQRARRGVHYTWQLEPNLPPGWKVRTGGHIIGRSEKRCRRCILGLMYSWPLEARVPEFDVVYTSTGVPFFHGDSLGLLVRTVLQYSSLK